MSRDREPVTLYTRSPVPHQLHTLAQHATELRELCAAVDAAAPINETKDFNDLPSQLRDAVRDIRRARLIGGW